jgi:ABC transporter substrate binding protein
VSSSHCSAARRLAGRSRRVRSKRIGCGRIGALMNLSLADAESQARTAAFLQALQRLGWTQGRNMHIDYRWAGAEAERFQPYAAELVALAPDVILAYASPAVAALQQTTRTVPVVFTSVIDPVGAGFVESLARPGGNVTGFTLSNTASARNGPRKTLGFETPAEKFNACVASTG